MYDVTARRHAQHPDGEPVNAAKSAPVAAKAAAIDAAQARPLTWKTVVKRALAVAVAGAALYLVLPKLIAVLGAWPRLSTLNPVWFTVCLAAELVSFTCNFALQRLALRTKNWFPVVTAGLSGNAVTSSLPGGSAAGAAAQFRMLTTAGSTPTPPSAASPRSRCSRSAACWRCPSLRCPPSWPGCRSAGGSSIPPCSASPRSSCTRSSG
jgi:hypothetical protein